MYHCYVYRLPGGQIWGVQAGGDHCADPQRGISSLAAPYPSPGDPRCDAVCVRHATSDYQQCRSA